MILNEHEKLSVENPLLKQQIISLEELNQLYVETDSIQKEELNLYKVEINSKEKEVKKAKRKTVLISTISSIISFLIGISL